MEETPAKLAIITRFFEDFSPSQLEKLGALEPLYREWNEKINVISRKDIDSLYEKHVLHSLSIAAAFDFTGGSQVIDIGTGGGFPGIPLAIFFPEVHFHLVDSIGKKLKVVDAIASELGLTNVSTMHTRAEDIKNRKFDVAVSRAVAPLKDLWTWSKPLLHKNPRKQMPQAPPTGETLPRAAGLICLKGGDLHQEIADSGCRPRMIEIQDIFPLPYYQGKFMLQVLPL